ncbi:VOC family protein, partial [Pseudomonas viridiflava]|uniref:VOC family protein n=1 Tax=Pseudomonas viridiflava TaxID=33069 RepID=UPI003C6E8C2B
VCAMAGMHPGTGGTRVYLNVEGQLDAVLDRVPNAGGVILQPRTEIAPHGFIALIKDSEGNSVGLHSVS